MRIKSYKRLAQFIILLGGLMSISYCYFNLFHIEDVVKWVIQFGIWDVFRYVIGMNCSGITLLLAGKPNNPIPFRSFLILVFGFLLLLLGIIVGAIVILIGGFLNLVDKKEEKN